MSGSTETYPSSLLSAATTEELHISFPHRERGFDGSTVDAGVLGESLSAANTQDFPFPLVTSLRKEAPKPQGTGMLPYYSGAGRHLPEIVIMAR